MGNRADRTTITEVDARVATVAKQQLADRERVLKLEKENAELRAAVEAITPKPKLIPDGFRADRNGDVTDADGKHRGKMHMGRFVEGIPENTAPIRPDGIVRKFPFNEVLGRIVDGRFVGNEAELAVAQEQAKQAEKARIQRLQAEDARLLKERQGVWIDVFGIKRIGVDGEEYGIGSATS